MAEILFKFGCLKLSYNSMITSYTNITGLPILFTKWNLFFRMYSISTYTFPLLTWIKSSMRSPHNTPDPQITQQLNPWLNIVQLFVDPPINLNDACNISTPCSKCLIHGQLLKKSLINLPFSQLQCGNYVDLLTLIWIHGQTCWNFIPIWYFLFCPITPKYLLPKWSPHKLLPP
jgi:hypothetical protein